MKNRSIWVSTITVLGVTAQSLAPLAAQSPDVSSLLIPPQDAHNAQYRAAIPKGEVRIVARLKDPPLAVAVGANAKRTGIRWTRAQQQSYAAQLSQKQDAIAAQVAGLGGRELARVSRAHNALVIAIDASKVAQVAAITGVSLVRPVVDYQLALSSTVPYVGAAALQTLGVNGTGITVAVLDSGIDYTHKNLLGAGTTGAYTAAYGVNNAAVENKNRDGLFPTAKVIEGWDFVGETWPNGAMASDPDPIDFEGHGTHVADIIAGKSADGTHKGVAPEAKLLAVKTCSAVSTSCNGVALLLGMDFALDPNGDGDLSDAADVINLSLGHGYGQREDDLSEACHIASNFGVVVVAAAGNDGDKPYVLSSPASTPAVIAVAQTEIPGATGYALVTSSPTGTHTNTATLSFAPVGAGVSNAPVAYVGRGCPAGSITGSNPDDPYLASPSGKVALIDRGSCSVSLKIDRAANAGAIGVLIGLVAAGDAISFSYGGGSTFVPSLVITQTSSTFIKANLTMLVTFGPSTAVPLTGSMVSSSARGPGYSYQSIKPDIGAPGASVSAQAGTGTGETVFGGTSGATPMVAGSAALLLHACNMSAVICSPQEIKARLMNNAETNIATSPLLAPGELAPITRIGGGELRVDRARQAMTTAWDAGDPSAISLSFGHTRVFGIQTLQRKVVVKNHKNAARTYNIASNFRYAADAASGAVTISTPATLNVAANSTGTFVVSMSINSGLLSAWTLNGGNRGGDGFRLQGQEYDGYVSISDAQDNARLPFHILTHKAANGSPSATSLNLGGGASAPITFFNAGGAVDAPFDLFALHGTSTKYPTSVLPRPGDNFAIVDLRAAGVRSFPADLGGIQHVLQFGISTWGERSHPNYPAEFDVFIDKDMNGINDYVIYNGEIGGFAASGQNVTTLLNLSTNASVTRFYTDADLVSGNAIYTVLMSDMGITPSTKFNATVCAGDNYYTGALTDCIGPMTITTGTPRFSTSVLMGSTAVNGSTPVTVTPNVAGDTASPTNSGVLVLYRDARIGREVDAIPVVP